ncbi:hypothetical protein E2562_015465 [Oryza meyeriana var. granulata]|uniref:Uncharacterized protein n=1 Tax=Oryza meyeriana var. granulata TaxID=110450 RepID=A0A6G1BX76_9ORYZ|nr:hypothetical protein E2562_015465 [Oryza meyeriana var. granulata]
MTAEGRGGRRQFADGDSARGSDAGGSGSSDLCDGDLSIPRGHVTIAFSPLGVCRLGLLDGVHGCSTTSAVAG